MNDKKYLVESIEEKGVKHNYSHEDVLGSVCYPAYVKVGERAWILYEEDEFLWPHRYHLSIVKAVTHTDDSIIIETENSIYTLKEVRE